ncbi:hypothetical protein C8J57DRAFT_1620950 [Mycena rebaudengoi]|nr:hypothetical protein C8J57DRAFT_1620950 [Mycena rebaudengoi]
MSRRWANQGFQGWESGYGVGEAIGTCRCGGTRNDAEMGERACLRREKTWRQVILWRAMWGAGTAEGIFGTTEEAAAASSANMPDRLSKENKAYSAIVPAVPQESISLLGTVRFFNVTIPIDAQLGISSFVVDWAYSSKKALTHSDNGGSGFPFQDVIIFQPIGSCRTSGTLPNSIILKALIRNDMGQVSAYIDFNNFEHQMGAIIDKTSKDVLGDRLSKMGMGGTGNGRPSRELSIAIYQQWTAAESQLGSRECSRASDVSGMSANSPFQILFHSTSRVRVAEYAPTSMRATKIHHELRALLQGCRHRSARSPASRHGRGIPRHQYISTLLPPPPPAPEPNTLFSSTLHQLLPPPPGAQCAAAALNPHAALPSVKCRIRAVAALPPCLPVPMALPSPNAAHPSVKSGDKSKLWWTL